MSEFHEKISIQFDIEFEVARCLLGSCDVKVKSLVEEFYCLICIALLSPFNKSFNENKLCIFLRIIPARLIDFINKL